MKVFIPEENNDEASLEEIIAEYTGPIVETVETGEACDSLSGENLQQTPDLEGQKEHSERKVWSWKRSQSAAVRAVGSPEAEDPSEVAANSAGRATMSDTMDLSRLGKSQARQSTTGENASRDSDRITPAAAARKCEHYIKSIRSRMLPLTALVVLMSCLTIFSKFSISLGGLCENIRLCSAVLFVCQLAACALGMDVLLKGFKDIRILQPRAESVLVFANLFSALHALVGIIEPEKSMGLPFCAIGTCAILFYQIGKLAKLRAERIGYKLYTSCPEPYGVYRRSGDWDGGDILTKQAADPHGFVCSCQSEDGTERIYSYVCPAMLILTVVSALIIFLHGGGITGFLRALSSLSCASAAFASTLCFSLPLRRLNRVLLHNGAAISSWAGAKDISRGGGVIIRDDDLFPPGRAVLSGMKIVGSSSVEWVLSVTASVIDASGSELARSFLELMLEQGGSRRRVESFRCDVSGGYTANVAGCNVYIGTQAFMKDHGIAVYDSLQVENGIYTAINSVLSAVFIVKYTPMAGVAAALTRFSHSSVFRPIFALRDFCIDNHLIEKTFSCRTDKMIFPDLVESGRFLALGSTKSSDEFPAGIICREGLTPYALLLIGGRRLYRRTMVSCILIIAAAVLGMEFMFFLGLSGNFTAASAANLLIYNLLWLLPSCMIGMSVSRL